MNVDQFVRLYTQRAPQIMWFLGAGASAVAGIPTAGQMIWDFKRQLFCSSQKVSIAACTDLTNPALQARIQRYFDDKGGYPPLGANDEYAFYFEHAFPNEMDRRSYLDRKVKAGVPTYGHFALAGLLRMNQAHVIWTTNFDRTVEDVCARIFGSTTHLTVATLSEPQVALQALNAARWPLLGKLHGDFQSRRLKNTTDELQAQDAELRKAFLESGRRFGMAVVGYSGRDESVMGTLHEAIVQGDAFPSGLFWFYRSESTPFSGVTALISDARSRGIDAHLVQVETFDELMGDVIRLTPNVPEEIVQHLDQRALRVSRAPLPTGGGSWPVIRLNALPITVSPSICRKLVCDIGGAGDVKRAIATAETAVVATRRKIGVLAFGSDGEIRKTFARYRIRDWDVHAIEPHRLRYESQEHSLLYDALAQALVRERPVVAKHKRGAHLLAVDTNQINNTLLLPLKEATHQLTGTVPSTSIGWAEAIRVRLDFKLDRLWLLVEPTIWIEPSNDDLDVIAGKEFRRERLARRYNDKWNKVLEGWVNLIVAGKSEAEIRAFGIGDGIDAAFTVGQITAFSRWSNKREHA